MAEKSKRPSASARSDTEYSSAADSEPDAGYESRSRSQSRRRRRQNQRQRQSTQSNANAGGASAQSKSLSTVQEEQQPDAGMSQRERDLMTMQPFEWIGKDETSMNGPVTYAKAMRGEIPPRPGNPNQQLATGPGGSAASKSIDEQDGLKLKLELNIDIEVELKATIRGDLTLALL